MTTDQWRNAPVCTYVETGRIQIDPLKGLDELTFNGGPLFHFPPPPGFKPLCKFDPRAPMKPLAAKLLGLGMAKTMAGR